LDTLSLPLVKTPIDERCARTLKFPLSCEGKHSRPSLQLRQIKRNIHEALLGEATTSSHILLLEFSQDCTRNFLTFVNTTAIAYGQKISRSRGFLPIYNSGRVYKRQKITSIHRGAIAIRTTLAYCSGPRKGTNLVVCNIYSGCSHF